MESQSQRPFILPQVTSWIKGVFEESDGSPSFSRCASGILLVCVICWITYHIVITKLWPDMTGPAVLITAPYGMNKLGGILDGLKKD